MDKITWKIKITNNPDHRILVRLNQLDDTIVFCGEKKINNNWVIFSELEHSININTEQLENALFTTYKIMLLRLKHYDALNNSFKLINEIEITNDDLDQDL